MIRFYQTMGVFLALIFSLQVAHAAVAPTADVDFGILAVGGDYNQEREIAKNPDNTLDPRALWFGFELTSAANLFLHTDTSQGTDTILALYDSSGSILGQNDDCGVGTPSNDLSSCLTIDNLGIGTYLAGITFYDSSFTPFSADWMLLAPSTEFLSSDFTAYGELTIDVSAVPVPAAVWLFGSALIGFVGMARRTTVKS